MNYDEVKLRSLIGKCQWTFAKTMPTCPHEYIVRNKPKSVIRISLCRTAKRNPLIFPI